MLKKYLVTAQPSGCIRTRYIIKAESSFGAIDKVWQRQHVLDTAPPYDADTYIAVRPATADDITKYGEWMI
jgi:hypothetical protein